MYNDKKEEAKLRAARRAEWRLKQRLETIEKEKERELDRAEWRLKQRLETIEYEHEVLRPELEDFNREVLEGKEPTIEIGPANDV